MDFVEYVQANATFLVKSCDDAAFSPDGTRVASGGGEIYEVATGMKLLQCDAFTRNSYVAWSPDSSLLAFIKMGSGQVCICSASSGEQLHKAKLEWMLDKPAFSRDSSELTFCTTASVIRWKFMVEKPIFEEDVNAEGDSWRSFVLPDGNVLTLPGTLMGVADAWILDAKTGKVLKQATFGQEGEKTSIWDTACSANGQIAALGIKRLRGSGLGETRLPEVLVFF